MSFPEYLVLQLKLSIGESPQVMQSITGVILEAEGISCSFTPVSLSSLGGNRVLLERCSDEGSNLGLSNPTILRGFPSTGAWTGKPVMQPSNSTDDGSSTKS